CRSRRVIQYLSVPVSVQQASPRHAGGVIDFERDFHGFSTRGSHTWSLEQGDLVLSGGLDLDISVDDRQGYENFLGDRYGVRGRLRRDERDEVRGLAPYLQLAWRGERLEAQAGARWDEVRSEVAARHLAPAHRDCGGRVTHGPSSPGLGLGYGFTRRVIRYAGGPGASKPRRWPSWPIRVPMAASASICGRHAANRPRRACASRCLVPAACTGPCFM